MFKAVFPQKWLFLRKQCLFPEKSVISLKIVFILRKRVLFLSVCQNCHIPAVAPTVIKCFSQNWPVFITRVLSIIRVFINNPRLNTAVWQYLSSKPGNSVKTRKFIKNSVFPCPNQDAGQSDNHKPVFTRKHWKSPKWRFFPFYSPKESPLIYKVQQILGYFSVLTKSVKIRTLTSQTWRFWLN